VGDKAGSLAIFVKWAGRGQLLENIGTVHRGNSRREKRSRKMAERRVKDKKNIYEL
jgi:hypothetical protein